MIGGLSQACPRGSATQGQQPGGPIIPAASFRRHG